MKYYILKLDKTVSHFTQQLPAMLRVGAFEVVGSYDSLEEASVAIVDLFIAKIKNGKADAHYEISHQNGAVEGWPGVYANPETLKGIYPPVAFQLPPLSSITGEELKAIRERLNMTQTEFGQYLGQSALRTVQAWEKGERTIPLTVSEILRLKGQL